MSPLPADDLPVLQDVERALRSGWDRDTSDDPEGWSQDNRALGQCAVSALIIRAIYGGDLVIATVLDRQGNPTADGHAWNILPSGQTVDVALDQFRDGELMAEPIVTEPVIVEDAYRAHRLAERVSQRLGIAVELPRVEGWR